MDKPEFTEEQMAAIEQAILRHASAESDWKLADDVKKELRTPAHDFRDGEVVMMHDSTATNGKPYQITKMTTDLGKQGSRHLTLSEMPQAVEDLREFVIWIGDGAVRIDSLTKDPVHEDFEDVMRGAKNLIAAFDAAIDTRGDSHE